MAVLSALVENNQIPNLYDIGIAGIGFNIAWEMDKELLSPWKAAYQIIEPDLVVDKTDVTTDEISENKLDYMYWESQRSWDYGAGQARFDLNATSFPSTRAFLDSQGVDTFSTIGQASLLPATTNILSLANGSPSSPQYMATTDSYVYVAAGQPNIKRFSKLDGSDAASVNSGTSTSQQSYGLASDGSTVYCALGPDGVTSCAPSVSTLLESFDSQASWTHANFALFQDNSTRQVQGTNCLFTQYTSSGGTGSMHKTISSTDVSTATFITIYLAQPGGGADGTAVAIKMGTNNTNYFQANLSISDNSGVWVKYSIPISSFTVALGSPSLSAITYLEVDLTAGGATDTHTMYLDDWEWVAPNSAFTSYSAIDTRVIAWAHNTLYGAGLQSSSPLTWQFFQIGPTSTSSVKLILPAGYTVSSIAELAGFVYFTATNGPNSVVYAYDGTNAPFVATPMSTGEQALVLIPFQGAGFLVGGRRLGSVTSNTGPGVLYRAFPDSTGHLTMERIQVFGTDNGNDYAITDGTSYLDFVYFNLAAYGTDPIPFAGQPSAHNAGLGVYYPQTGGWAWHLEDNTSPSGHVDAVVVFKNTIFFSMASKGVLAATKGSYVTSAWLLGSLMDWDIDSLKLLVKGEMGFQMLPAATNELPTLPYTSWTNTGMTSLSGAVATMTGTGSPAASYAESQSITVIPGQLLSFTCAIDATHVTNNAGLYVGVDYGSGYATAVQTAGVSSTISGTYRVAAGVTSVKLIISCNGTTIANGLNLTFTSPTLTAVNGFELDLTTETVTQQLVTSDYTAADVYTSAGIYETASTAYYTVKFTSDGSHNVLLKKAGFSAMYGSKPRRDYKVAIKAHEYGLLNNGVPDPRCGPSFGHQILTSLETLRNTQTVVQFQPVGYGEEHTDVVNVRIGAINMNRQFLPAAGWAVTVLIELIEMPS